MWKVHDKQWVPNNDKSPHGLWPGEEKKHMKLKTYKEVFDIMLKFISLEM